MELYVGEKKVGVIPNEAVSTVYYCCQSWGFQVEMNKERTRLNINPPFSGYALFINAFSSPMEEELQKKISKQLESLGIVVKVSKEGEFLPGHNYFLSLQTKEEKNISQPSIQIRYSAGKDKEYWLELIKLECLKAGIMLKIQMREEDTLSQKIHVLVHYPEGMSHSTWGDLSNKITHILSVGLISKLQESLGVSTLSLVPLTTLLGLLKSNNPQEVSQTKEKKPQPSVKRELVESVSSQEASYRLDSYFDYHIVVNETRKYPNIMGKLYLRNAGTQSLKNPTICFRITPVGSVDISGQLLIPKVKHVFGIQTNQGTIGWQYLTNNWLEEADDKGEVWIKPIENLEIAPNTSITVPNLQFKLNTSNVYNEVKVEAFIFFQEENYQVGANNKISLLFTPNPGE